MWSVELAAEFAARLKAVEETLAELRAEILLATEPATLRVKRHDRPAPAQPHNSTPTKPSNRSAKSQ